jgi:peptidoglycan-N-acetylglucosamine deacetylase
MGMGQAGAIPPAAAYAAAIGLCGALLAAAPVRAESCPGNPDALGTSRALVVSPTEYQRLGTMQYPDTLPLADHEVVLTFDDGPLPPSTDKVIEALTAQCVKATFFIVGEMARSFPQVVRREYELGFTIGTHSQNHPLRFEELTGDKLAYQIDAGIASVSAALGDPDDLAPFFRIPGLGRSKAVEQALADRSLVVFSVDVDADDWFRHVTAAQVVQKAISRLEKHGRGILLLHDIHPWTAEAVPTLLKELKDHGFHVVHIVPPAPTGSKIAGGPKAWALAAAMPQAGLVDKGAISPTWPQPAQSKMDTAAADVVLPAPDQAAFSADDPTQADSATADSGAATEWPQPDVVLASSTEDFAAPGLSDLGVSLRDEKLVGVELGLRPSLEAPRARERERVRRVRLHAHRPVRARAGVEGQHADLLSERAVAAASAQTPAH